MHGMAHRMLIYRQMLLLTLHGKFTLRNSANSASHYSMRSHPRVRRPRGKVLCHCIHSVSRLQKDLR